jgi:hypothetical protein
LFIVLVALDRPELQIIDPSFVDLNLSNL